MISIFIPLAVGLFFVPSLFSATIYRVDQYASQNQSPFYEGIANGTLYFNDFESFPSPPFPSNFTSSPTTFSDVASVDGDDGVFDGQGHGHSLKSNISTRPRFVFNFTADAQGHYPRYFGAVFTLSVTGIGPNFTPGEVLGAKDAFGVDIFSSYAFPTPAGQYTITTPPGSLYWATFLGIYSETGISQVTLNNAALLDHLQFGYSIPEASSLLSFSVVGLAGFALRRRRPQIP